ncbi:hypothetical protein GGS24DRAFT_492692 [Hypoxylon argillaceum]|nr:hypothetical protein GGS24DRAFT_492692 [Hypoxylon argillaceum]
MFSTEQNVDCDLEKGHIHVHNANRCTVNQHGERLHYVGYSSRPGLLPFHTLFLPSPFPFEHHKNNLVRVIEKRNRWTPPVQFKLKRQQTSENSNDKSRNWARKSENKDFRISLAELHRMHLRKLQCKLVSHVGYMRKFNKEPENWESDLEKYIKAVQDYDYMTTCCNLPRDPFLVTGERQIDSFVIHSILGDVPEDKFEDILPVDGPWEDEPHPIGGTRNYSVVKGLEAQLKDRIMIAAIAGFFLIAPMWLMVLHNTLYTSLVSATAFVTVFGLVLAWFLDTRKEVMSGTAAYAAVLVVFVGIGHT